VHYRCSPSVGEEKIVRRTILLLGTMLVALVVASGVAFAVIQCHGGVCRGTNNHDLIYGTNGYDEIYGRGGPDVIYGYGGNDTIYGGAGDDTIYGGAGKDYIRGGPGYDKCDGGPGYDQLHYSCEEQLFQ
jgi:Ca2+-binding RTX toxin-like protein